MFCLFQKAIYERACTEWKGNKCQASNSRRGRLKGPRNVYTIWGLNLIVSSEKGVSCSVLFTSQGILLILLEIMRKNLPSVGLSYMGVILFSEIFYVFDVVYVKSNSIPCKFSDLNVPTTL